MWLGATEGGLVVAGGVRSDPLAGHPLRLCDVLAGHILHGQLLGGLRVFVPLGIVVILPLIRPGMVNRAAFAGDSNP